MLCPTKSLVNGRIMINQQILSEGRIKEIKHRQLLAGIKKKAKTILYQHLNAALRWIIPFIRRDGPIAELEIGSQLEIGVTSRELVSFLPTFTDASFGAKIINSLQIGLGHYDV